MRIGKAAVILLTALLLLTGCGRREKTDKTVVVLEATPAPSAAVPDNAADSRDWYGWWRMDHCSGDWKHMYGYYWDCCAELTEAEDGRTALLLWDEDVPRDVGLARVELEERDSSLHVVSGSFLDQELDSSDWRITRSEDACGTLLTIEGDYEAVGKGGFHYAIWIRPWGSRWPGSKDERPGIYESWYLPLIEAGESMPDVIGNREEKGNDS